MDIELFRIWVKLYPDASYMRKRTDVARLRMRRLYKLWWINPRYFVDTQIKVKQIRIATKAYFNVIGADLTRYHNARLAKLDAKLKETRSGIV